MHSVAWHCEYPATWQRERLVQLPLLLHFSSPCQIVASWSCTVQSQSAALTASVLWAIVTHTYRVV